MSSNLHYLFFDISDDTDGVICFDALAATRADHRVQALQEAHRVLDWARAQFPNGPGSVQDGHDWDFDLQQSLATGAAQDWHELSLSITANEAFAQAFRAEFAQACEPD